MINNDTALSQALPRPARPAGDAGASAPAPREDAASAGAAVPARATSALTETAVAAPAPAAPSPAAPPPVGAELRELLDGLSERLNEFMQENARELEFQVNSESNRVVILVRQAETGDVLRSIPPEEALALADKLADNPDDSAGVLLSALA